MLGLPASAQDARAVTEPVIPASCSTLTAQLSATSGNTSLAVEDETRLDTTRIQGALDACPQGRAVELVAAGGKNAFLSGPLQLRAGVGLVVRDGAILFGSRNPRDYDVSPGSCGIVDQQGRGCRALITGDHVSNAAVMGGGVIDGRGGATLIGQNVTWWDLAEQARGGDRHQNCPRILELFHADNFVLYRITLKNSGNFHVFYSGGSGFTAWGVVINTPKTARNTDGIDPVSATNVTITHCYIHAGDDNVAIKAGDSGPASHMTISHNHFYAGHGISIGSETNGGAHAIRVTDLSIEGADNGIRIKSNDSRGGVVEDVVYEDVCIRDTKNPILMDTHYSFSGERHDLIPTFEGIALHNVRVLTKGKITLDGYDSAHPLGILFDDVILDDAAGSPIQANFARISVGPGPVNFHPSGRDIVITGEAAKGKPNSCHQKFVPMPEK